ncbi:MAG: domain S-box, partial [Proteobacteria bacterium]|nr:domain S-box [Pseudomonadota bacterium]
SLNPINPLNAADAWERQSLEAFAHGVQERASIEVMDDGRTYFRYMKPMVTEEACLKCHAQHGEKLGDIRGGVTVSVPIDDLLLSERNTRNALIGGHGLIWGMGIFGLFCGGRRQQRAIFAAEQAEERVRAVSLYTRSLIEASLDPLVTISAEGRITDVNEATVNATGISREDLIGSDFSDYFTEPEMARAGYREVFAKGFVTDYPLAIRHASGKTMEVLYNASVYHDEKGNVAGVFAAARDVTERKRAEEEVRRLNAELEQRVEARTAELHAANAELYSFAYAVSHDLRAPLRAMSGFSQALKEDYGDHLDGDARGYLDQISLASRHMSDLIDGLLTLSRSTRGELNQETLDISAMAERLLAELSAAEPARRVAWTVEPGMQAQCDATMIEVVMRNLIDNAWKYTDKTPDATIRVYTGETEGQRCFCVSDNGAGFDMTHAGKLFQPFQRLHRQEEFPGIGIGLATVQRIVHRHGGAIWAEGAPGQGATFCFTLLNPGPMDKEIS